MKNIKDLINDRTITLTELAEKAGVTRQTLNNIIKDKVKPSLLVTRKICAAFGVDYKDYIEE